MTLVQHGFDLHRVVDTVRGAGRPHARQYHGYDLAFHVRQVMLEHVIGEASCRKDRGMPLDLVVRDAPHRIEPSGGIQVVDRLDRFLVQETQRVFRLQEFLQPVHVIMGYVFRIGTRIGRDLHLVQMLQAVQRLFGGQPVPFAHGLLQAGQVEQGRRLRMLAAPSHLQDLRGKPHRVGQYAACHHLVLDLPAFERPTIHRHDKTPERCRLV